MSIAWSVDKTLASQRTVSLAMWLSLAGCSTRPPLGAHRTWPEPCRQSTTYREQPPPARSASGQQAPSVLLQGLVSPEADRQVVSVTVGKAGFIPNRLEFAHGKPATVRFTRYSEVTCAKKVVFPDIGLERDLPFGTPVDIAVPTESERTLTFNCPTGQHRSDIYIRIQQSSICRDRSPVGPGGPVARRCKVVRPPSSRAR